jgi:peptidoglycan hydrolase FlgJ
MNVPSSSSPSLASDTRSIDALRSTAARDPKAAIKEAAKQFEALFMQQLMKSMREATMSSGMLENSGTQMGTEMLDVQFANKMTGLPGGLSDVIARQLERQMTGTVAPIPAATTPVAAPTSAPTAADLNVSQQQLDFMRAHRAEAESVQAQSGIPAAFMVGQAAHESGWGQREIRNADGTSSHNLFGIKAGAGWSGPVAEVTTTEYTHGEARKVTAKFRAYGSYEESFRDYARLIKDSPRYAGVMAQGSAQGYAQGLQRAGYATDPAYADKLARVINKTLHWQRVMT